MTSKSIILQLKLCISSSKMHNFTVTSVEFSLDKFIARLSDLEMSFYSSQSVLNLATVSDFAVSVVFLTHCSFSGEQC